MLPALILAAGASTRMGSPKALLKIGGKTFVRHIVDVLGAAGIVDIVIVLGAEAGQIKDSLDWFDGKIVVNKDWKKGQLTSLVAGLGSIDRRDLHGVLICPVDHPLFAPQVIRGMCEAAETSPHKIIIPVFKERRGHPVIFPASLIEVLKRASPEIGARQVVRDHPDEVLEFVTEDEGVVRNIDTPEDYGAFMG